MNFSRERPPLVAALKVVQTTLLRSGGVSALLFISFGLGGFALSPALSFRDKIASDCDVSVLGTQMNDRAGFEVIY